MKPSVATFAAAAPINASAMQFIKRRRNIPPRKLRRQQLPQQEAPGEHNAYTDQRIAP